MPDLIAVHAGSLDDPNLFRPSMVTYRIRGFAWDTIDFELVVVSPIAPGNPGLSNGVEYFLRGCTDIGHACSGVRYETRSAYVRFL
jgi:hypothetical protein